MIFEYLSAACPSVLKNPLESSSLKKEKSSSASVAVAVKIV